MKIIKKALDAIRTWKNHRTTPLRLEFIVTDYCNLNCKGCSHFSPVAPKDFAELDVLTEQLRHLASVDHKGLVEKLYIIGGEPLTAPVDTLTGMARLMRHYFPKAEISLFTNGIALSKMPEQFWKSMKNNDVILAITRYPIKFNYDALEESLKDKGVKFSIFADRNMEHSFFRVGMDPEGRQNGRLSHFRCLSFGCVSIRDGRVYPCPTSACVSHLNNKFNLNFEHLPGDYLKIEDITDTRQILKLRNKPVPFCRYCRRPDPVKYGASRREESEWVVRKPL